VANRWRIVVMGSAALAAGCALGPLGRREWPAATPDAQRLDAERLRDLVSRMERGSFGELTSLLVVRHGRLVVERYFRGAGPDDPQPLASVTKSVTSLLVGIAEDQGRLPGLDTPLAGLLPEYADLFTDGDRRSITLEHVLTMTTGLAWFESAPPLPFAGERAGWLRVVLRQPLTDRPGARFNYNSGTVMVLSAALQRAYRTPVSAFAARALFRPLGFGASEWPAIDEGLTPTAGGLALRPRDLAKIGQLLLEGGSWRGRRVVSEAWLQRSTAALVPGPEGSRYGYLWWRLPEVLPPGAAILEGTVYAGGAGDQYLFVVPRADLVVVVTGRNYERHFVGPLGFLVREIVPALRDSA
jgi:CubicO group peptidase (beta-lactamase class C family)